MEFVAKTPHPNSKKLNTLLRYGWLKKTISDFHTIDQTCMTCSLSKSTALPFPLSLLALVLHLDKFTIGASPIISCLGYRYFVLFIDDFTKYTCIYFLPKNLRFILITKYLEQWLLLNSLPILNFEIWFRGRIPRSRV